MYFAWSILMEFQFIDEGINAIIIDGYYNDAQLNNIFKELNFLTCPEIMSEDKDKLEAAVDVDGKFVTNKSGVWLDHVYRNWRDSHLMRYMFDNLVKDQVRQPILSHNSLFKILYSCNHRGHLLSYYENSGYYSKHRDEAVFTILNYFNKEPKQFEGGVITVHSHDQTKKAEIEVKNNRVIIIPSCADHEVSPITMSPNQYSGNGRYCLSCFTSVINSKEINGK
jgi:predicted 2-oxoglutarate/Fe(II)-dependent dioxygenase YbiX